MQHISAIIYWYKDNHDFSICKNYLKFIWINTLFVTIPNKPHPIYRYIRALFIIIINNIFIWNLFEIYLQIEKYWLYLHIPDCFEKAKARGQKNIKNLLTNLYSKHFTRLRTTADNKKRAGNRSASLSHVTN